MYKGITAAVLLLFVCTLVLFRAANGRFADWNGSDLANFGTFVGGTLGVFALVAAFMQFLASTKAQRESIGITLEERHRVDLRIEISRVEERIERLLEDFRLSPENKPDSISIGNLLNGPLWVLNKNELPNYKTLELAARSNSEGSFSGSQVKLFFQLSTISLRLNDLLELANNFDKVSKSNLMSVNVTRNYSRIISALEELEYPINRS